MPLAADEGTPMSDPVADTARFMNVVEAIVAEFQRQGVDAEMAGYGFDTGALAKAVIAASDGHAIPFPSLPR
jgi:biotin carboxylase